MKRPDLINQNNEILKKQLRLINYLEIVLGRIANNENGMGRIEVLSQEKIREFF